MGTSNGEKKSLRGLRPSQRIIGNWGNPGVAQIVSLGKSIPIDYPVLISPENTQSNIIYAQQDTFRDFYVRGYEYEGEQTHSFPPFQALCSRTFQEEQVADQRLVS